MYYNCRKIEIPKIKIVGSVFQIKVEEASLKTFTNWIHQALIEENLKKIFEIDIL